MMGVHFMRIGVYGMNDIERAIDVQQKLIKKWENRAKELEEVIEKHPWEKMGYESADWRESELKRRKEQILTALITISALEKQLNGDWIPVSERLPEEYGCYLVAWRPLNLTAEDIIKNTGTVPHYFEILAFDPIFEGDWIDEIEQCDEYELLAWQPLPPAYKEASNGK